MIPVESIVAFTIASALLSIAPGPDNVFVLMQSALHGKKSGILVTLGLCTGLIVHTTAVALGVAAILQTSAAAFTALKLAGAAYLGYLAWQAFRASATSWENRAPGCRSPGALYLRGIIMNVTNPKVSIFFMAFLPQFAAPEHGQIALQVFFLGGVFIIVALCIFSAIALVSGVLGNWLRESHRAQVYLNRVAGAVFAALALRLATASAVSE